MKYLDRVINYIFSLFVLILSAVVVLISAGLVEYNYVSNSISSCLFSSENRTITCIVSLVVFVAALKTTIFLSKWTKKKKSVVMVDTNHGKIQIAQETIESTAKGVTKQYSSIKDTQVRMTKEKKGINIYMAMLVEPDTNIMELTSKVQDEVKEAVENSTGVKVNNVDIRIKNISEGKFKTKASPIVEKAEEKVSEENRKEEQEIAELPQEDTSEEIQEEVVEEKTEEN